MITYYNIVEVIGYLTDIPTNMSSSIVEAILQYDMQCRNYKDVFPFTTEELLLCRKLYTGSLEGVTATQLSQAILGFAHRVYDTNFTVETSTIEIHSYIEFIVDGCQGQLVLHYLLKRLLYTFNKGSAIRQVFCYQSRYNSYCVLVLTANGDVWFLSCGLEEIQDITPVVIRSRILHITRSIETDIFYFHLIIGEVEIYRTEHLLDFHLDKLINEYNIYNALAVSYSLIGIVGDIHYINSSGDLLENGSVVMNVCDSEYRTIYLLPNSKAYILVVVIWHLDYEIEVKYVNIVDKEITSSDVYDAHEFLEVNYSEDEECYQLLVGSCREDAETIDIS